MADRYNLTPPASTVCRACAAAIVFLPTAAGKSIPVNANTLLLQEIMGFRTEHKNDQALPLYSSKTHVAHFATCPAANKFRKKKR